MAPCIYWGKVSYMMKAIFFNAFYGNISTILISIWPSTSLNVIQTSSVCASSDVCIKLSTSSLIKLPYFSVPDKKA